MPPQGGEVSVYWRERLVGLVVIEERWLLVEVSVNMHVYSIFMTNNWFT